MQSLFTKKTVLILATLFSIIISSNLSSNQVRAQPPSPESTPSNSQGQNSLTLSKEQLEQLKVSLDEKYKNSLDRLDLLITGLGLLLTFLTLVPILLTVFIIAMRGGIMKSISNAIQTDMDSDIKAAKDLFKRTNKGIKDDLDSTNLIVEKIIETLLIRQIIDLLPEVAVMNFEIKTTQERQDSIKNLETKYKQLIDSPNFSKFSLPENLNKLIDYVRESNINQPSLFIREKDYVKIADISLYRGDFDSALALYRKANQNILSLQLYEPYLRMGLCYDHKDEFEEAERCYLNCLKLDPERYPAWNNLSQLYFKKGRYQEALNYANGAIKLNPNCALAYNNKGIALGCIGEFLEEDKAYDEAIELNPYLYLPWYNRACSYSLQNRATEALEALERAIEFNPSVKEDAKLEKDFANIRDNEGFKKLVESY